MTQTILPTNKHGLGFWSTIRHDPIPPKPARSRTHAITATTGCPAHVAREFLDSCYERHFADEVAKGLCRLLAANAIDAA